MASRMIDLQQIIAKSAEDVQRIQQMHHQAPRTQQDQRTYQAVEEQEIRRKQAQEAPRPEEQKIRDEAQLAKQRRYRIRDKGQGARGKKEKEEKIEFVKDHKYGKIIDIKV